MICACRVMTASSAARPAAVSGFQACAIDRIFERPIDRRDRWSDGGVVGLGILHQQAVHDRDADARADIARQAEKAGTFRPLCERQRRQSRRAKRHEQKAETGALDHGHADDGRLRYVRRPSGHLIERPRGEGKTKGEQEAGVDATDQPADDQHGRHGANAARPHHQAGGDDRIVHELLQVRRLQRHRGVIGESDDGDEQHAGREIAVAKHRRPHKRIIRSKHVNEEQIQSRGGNDRFDDDLAGAEPVELLAAVEHDLEAADGDA